MPDRSALEARLRTLPTRPGVYLFRDAAGEILYVGKAKSLRSRVRSYFAASAGHGLKTRELVRRVADVETIVVDTEAEALILENNLIKEHRPRFNVTLRDDKTYPYIKVTVAEPFPRVLVTRRLERDGSRYFGPFTDVRRMRQALEVVKRLHTVRSCHYDLPGQAPDRPCLDHQIGRCKAPCVGLQSEADYRVMIDEVVDVLEGRTARVAERLRGEMAAAAEAMEFEKAAELRDVLARLDRLEERQRVVDLSGADRDVVGAARDGADACVVVLQVRDGKLLGREVQFLEGLDEEDGDASAAGTAATRRYAALALRDPDAVPPEILLSDDFEDRALLEELLRDRVGRAVRLRVPKRGEKTRLVELADQNARHLLEERRLMQGAAVRAPDALYELQETLELPEVPRTLVCFDVSHTQGSETVASAVWFDNGGPNKAEYRRFRVRGEWGNDDFRSMEEVVGRFFRRRVEEGRPLPDLAVIDGGKGQLGAAVRALEEIGLPQQAVISLAKRDEEVFLPGRPDPVRLPRRSPALRLLQRARDEAHRFAVTFNRRLRSKRTIRSSLSDIPNVGAARQRALLARFGSVRAIGGATEEEIAAVPGFGPALARAVLRHVRGEAEAAAE